MSLWTALSASANLSNIFLWGAHGSAGLGDWVRGSALVAQPGQLRGRSVLIATKQQLTAALALIELDGVARRLVLCPSDLPTAYLPSVIEAADIDTIVSDQETLGPNCPPVECFITCSPKITPVNHDRHVSCQTEWVLLTSGTTGQPKLVVHTLASLAGALEHRSASPGRVVWSTFYDIRRYGGLQIFLRAVLKSTSLVLSSAEESTFDFLVRAGAHGVTHISGTPSHWRRALMSRSAHAISPQYVRLSGEISDDAILGQLKAFYPQAKIAHAFASTEAGLAFEVNDGRAGFPATFVGQPASQVEMKVEDGSLRIRSSRTAARYLGCQDKALQGPDGYVDTGDMLELRGDRFYFQGRRDGMINVGGQKVHPEEVEAVINRHPRVRMSLVRTRKNPITGALVVADVVLGRAPGTPQESVDHFQHEILQLCRDMLPRHKVPAMINIVSALSVDETGKLVRHHA